MFGLEPRVRFYFGHAIFSHQSTVNVYWFAILSSAALLTKQNAVFLIPFCLLSGLGVRGWRLFLQAPVLRAVAICVVLIAPVLWARLHGSLENDCHGLG